MLQAMGLRLWLPERTAADVAAAPAPAAVIERAAAPGPMTRAVPQPAPRAAPTPAPAPSLAPILASTPRATAGTDGRADQIATLDWPALREAVAGCRACGLCEGRTQTVFGVGHPQAHWMVVGEAPGEQEDRQGEPLVGPAGQLLDNMLRALQLSRADEGPAAERVYIANTLKCRPPRNRNPAPEEMAACEPFLLRQLALVRPRIILAMGRFAVQALLQSSEPIGKLRGRVHAYQGVPLVVTYHPAYLLRNLPDKARAWEDLCLAARVAEAGP